MTKCVQFVCLVALSFTTACQQSNTSNGLDGLEVVRHEVATGRYAILDRMHDNGRYVVSKIIAVCKSYQWGHHPTVNGADACDLGVGRIYRTNLLDTRRAKSDPDIIVNLSPGQDALLIQEGSGEDKTSNYLAIESISVVHETAETAN